MFKNCCGCQNSKQKKKQQEDGVVVDTHVGVEVEQANRVKSPCKTIETIKETRHSPSVTVTEPPPEPSPTFEGARPDISTETDIPILVEPEDGGLVESPVTRTEPEDQTNEEEEEGGGEHSSEFVTGLDIAGDRKDSRIELPAQLAQDLLSSGAIVSGCEILPRGASATPHPSKRGSILSTLPKWSSQDEEDVFELGGTQEPPATPVGRDELAMRRHRFFSDLLLVQQAGSEHRVRFDPLGPTIAGGSYSDSNCSSVSHLEGLINRLEQVTERLESQSHSPLSVDFAENLTPSCSPDTTNMSVAAFNDILSGPVASYLKLSATIGGDVATHSKLVDQAFKAQLQYLTNASQSRAPASQNDLMTLLKPTSSQIQAIQEFREKNRGSGLFNHLSAISESIPALGWVAVSPAPSPYVKEMNDAGQFYTNRVLKDFKEKDKTHVEWVKAWVQTLSELQQFVKQHHTTGLVWGGKGTAGPPPPPPGMPPPPPVLPVGDVTALADDGKDRSALFAEINRGEGITSSLKKVTSDMQTHKNTALRSGPAPFKTPSQSSGTSSVSAPKSIDKPPSFVKEGKKYLIEYQNGNNSLLIENGEMNNMIYMFRCQNSTLTVKGKVNAVILDSCKKTSVVFDTLVSSVEFVNCQSVQMQVLDKVPTISIDKTDGCQMYLSANSLDVEIVSSKSSEMNVLVPKGNGDYTEYAVAEQFKTTVSAKGLTTIAVDSLG